MNILSLSRRLLLCSVPVLVCAQQPGALSNVASTQDASVPQAAGAPGSQSPALVQRPPSQSAITASNNSIQLNVVVTDSKGMPVSGLTQKDFTLLDNKQSRPIVSFHAYDGTSQKPNSPVQVIFLLDTVNIGFVQVAFARQEMGKFLEENGGHLAQPVSIFLFTNSGVSVQREPFANGNAEAAALSQIDSGLRSIPQSSGVYGAIERFQLSLQALSSVVEMEAAVPGRKLLIWIGPGWPMLSGVGFQDSSPEQQQQVFGTIVALSTRLRESEITLYSISSGLPDGYSNYYQSFLKGVSSPRQTDNADLGLKVFATRSGGLVLGPGNVLVDQIDRCVRDASAYYTITFDPPAADKQNEYHDLKVQVDRQKLTVRTNAGYYDNPSGPTTRPTTP